MQSPSLCTVSLGVHAVHLMFSRLDALPNAKVSHRCAIQFTCLFPEEVCKVQDPLVYRILLLRLLLWLLLYNTHRHNAHHLSDVKGTGPNLLEYHLEQLCTLDVALVQLTQLNRRKGTTRQQTLLQSTKTVVRRGRARLVCAAEPCMSCYARHLHSAKYFSMLCRTQTQPVVIAQPERTPAQQAATALRR